MPSSDNPLMDAEVIEALLQENLAQACEASSKPGRRSGKTPYCRPSMIECARRAVYRMLGYEEPVSPELMAIFEVGRQMHERYQRWFQEIGLLSVEDTEVSFVSHEHRVSGRVDGVLRVPGTDWSCILELKSAKKSDFTAMKQSGRPLEKHLMQVMLYMALTEYKESLILVECKDNQRRLYFPVSYSEDEGRKVLERVKLINSCVDRRVLPEREHPPSSSECYWCYFKEMCAKNEI